MRGVVVSGDDLNILAFVINRLPTVVSDQLPTVAIALIDGLSIDDEFDTTFDRSGREGDVAEKLFWGNRLNGQALGVADTGIPMKLDQFACKRFSRGGFVAGILIGAIPDVSEAVGGVCRNRLGSSAGQFFGDGYLIHSDGGRTRPRHWPIIIFVLEECLLNGIIDADKGMFEFAVVNVVIVRRGRALCRRKASRIVDSLGDFPIDVGITFGHGDEAQIVAGEGFFQFDKVADPCVDVGLFFWGYRPLLVGIAVFLPRIIVFVAHQNHNDVGMVAKEASLVPLDDIDAPLDSGLGRFTGCTKTTQAIGGQFAGNPADTRDGRANRSIGNIGITLFVVENGGHQDAEIELIGNFGHHIVEGTLIFFRFKVLAAGVIPEKKEIHGGLDESELGAAMIGEAAARAYGFGVLAPESSELFLATGGEKQNEGEGIG